GADGRRGIEERKGVETKSYLAVFLLGWKIVDKSASNTKAVRSKARPAHRHNLLPIRKAILGSNTGCERAELPTQRDAASQASQAGSGVLMRDHDSDPPEAALLRRNRVRMPKT